MALPPSVEYSLGSIQFISPKANLWTQGFLKLRENTWQMEASANQRQWIWGFWLHDHRAWDPNNWRVTIWDTETREQWGDGIWFVASIFKIWKEKSNAGGFAKFGFWGGIGTLWDIGGHWQGWEGVLGGRGGHTDMISTVKGGSRMIFWKII